MRIPIWKKNSKLNTIPLYKGLDNVKLVREHPNSDNDGACQKIHEIECWSELKV